MSATLWHARPCKRWVWPLASVTLSNHKGYGRWHAMAEPLDVASALASLAPHVAWPKAAVLSGYMSEPAQAQALAQHLGAQPVGFYLLDPVLGDEGPGLYVDPGLVPVYRDQLVPLADAVCLNYFEFCTLTGCKALSDFPGLLRAWAPASVLVTSVPSPQGLAIWGKADEGLWQVETPKLEASAAPDGIRLALPNGLGDLVSALWLDGLMRGAPMAEVLPSLADRVFALLQASLDAGRRELDLIGHRHLLVQAPARFASTKIP